MRAHMYWHLRHTRTKRTKRRHGTIAILAAVLLVVLLGMIAFAVDVGYMANIQGELDRAVDAGALAGAGVLAEGEQQAQQTVYDFVGMNLVGTDMVSANDVQIEMGIWDPEMKIFEIDRQPSAIRVHAQRLHQPLFFAKILGHDTFGVQSEAIAVYQPRDIMLVLDCSASMNDDSELRHIDSMGQATVEANLLQIYQELGSPVFGNMQWQPVLNASNQNWRVMRALGLNDVPYPFPSGSWDDYISYVRTSGYINDAGYRKRYGYLTLVNYWLEKRPRFSQTPELWHTSEQPITAVKDAVTVFLAYLQEVETKDQLGLAIYTSTNDTALLEMPLSEDFQQIEDVSRRRQAGHYDTMTNIGAGIRTARLELEDNARGNTFKMIVLMTDGVANLPNDRATAQQHALNQAQLCADDGYPIVTISLGAGADIALMDQIASITDGMHFNIPGDQTVAQYEEELKDVFREIASDRPLQLVK